MSQSEKILCALKTGKPVTPLIALRRFGCMRLAARIGELRRDGHRVRSRMVTIRGKRFASYWL